MFLGAENFSLNQYLLFVTARLHHDASFRDDSQTADGTSFQNAIKPERRIYL